MSLNSITLKFVLLGSDTQTGMSLIGLFEERNIPFESFTLSECAAAESISECLQAFASYPFVVNCLFESAEDRLDCSLWAGLNQQIVNTCQQQKQTLIMLSSMLVFSGRSERSYLETDKPDAETDVGVLYRLLESQALDSDIEALVLRTGWLFSEQLNNILTQLISAAVRQECLQFSGNLKGCPTDAHSVAKVIIAMAEQIDCHASSPALSGIYHYADSDVCSIHTFAKTVITIIKSMTDVKVETIEEGDTQDMIDAVTEPENFEPSCKKILMTFGIKQRPWRRSVHEVLKNKLQTPEPIA